MPEIAFLAANLIKIHDGGWFPLLVGLGLFVVMVTWKRGREIVGERFRERIVPLSDFYELLACGAAGARPGHGRLHDQQFGGHAAGAASEFSAQPIGASARRCCLTVATEDTPYVDAARRARIEAARTGLHAHRGALRLHGEPERAEAARRASFQDYSREHTTFFLGRETLIATERPGMAIWREKAVRVSCRATLSRQRRSSVFRRIE